MHKSLWIPLATSLFLIVSPHASATESISSMQKNIDVFLSTPDQFFAPITSSRASAYLGAARLADEQDKTQDVQHALEKSFTSLTEAQNNAAKFQKKYDELLQLRQATQQAISFVRFSDAPPQPNPITLLQSAEDVLTQAIKAHEAGQLNNMSQAIIASKQAYTIALQAGLPFLIDEVGSVISTALGARVKRHAPITYEAGKQELSKLIQYSDGLIDEIPLHPTYALSLVKRALTLTKHIKTLKKSSKSKGHEELLLSAQKNRLKIAASIGVPTHPYDAMFDVSVDDLKQHIQALKQQLKQQQQAHVKEISALKQQQQIDIQQATDKLRASLTSDQHQQLSNMKDAFRAKLDRETFEQRRQKQVRKLFKKGEMTLLVNSDGSLLLRVLALDFSSNSSKISPRNYDLLSRVKTALDAYGDRKIRIEGHTDNIGDAKPNQKLSLKRAEAVRDYLIAAHANAGNLTARGWGESFPIATNDYKQGRAKNRRIDIIIQASD